jgi:hypothetical protein
VQRRELGTAPLSGEGEVYTTAQELAAEVRDFEIIQARLRHVRREAQELEVSARASAQRALMFGKLQER